MPNLIGEWPQDVATKIDLAVAALSSQIEPGVHGQVNIVLSDDAAVAKLNRDHGGGDYATDVLTFSYIEAGAQPMQDGEEVPEVADVIISLQMAERQAAEAGTDTETELVLLVVHGLLHVLGYDHGDTDAKAVMERLQSDIMEAIGLTYREFKWQQ